MEANVRNTLRQLGRLVETVGQDIKSLDSDESDEANGTWLTVSAIQLQACVKILDEYATRLGTTYNRFESP